MAILTAHPEIDIYSDYVPSVEAWNFHSAPHRFRFVCWGIKGGKSHAGAQELCMAALSMPGKQSWVVAPTYHHLMKVAWVEVQNILNQWEGLVMGYNRQQHQIRLVHGGVIDFRSADWPDNLKGPNVDIMWIDEAALLKPEAWWYCRERVSATKGEIFMTFTPMGQNWIWDELRRAGLPADAPYGEFENGDRFVSHFPTWQFDWVDQEDIDDVKLSMPKAIFDREYGALFTSSASEVFRNVEKCLSLELPPTKIEGSTVIGVDLAKFQDFTAVVVMMGDGRVIHIDHWNETNWAVQKPRLIKIAKDWNGVIVLDRSNVGSVIEEELMAEDVDVFPVDLHDSRKKNQIVEGTQIAFEQCELKIPDYRASWAGHAEHALYDELKAYRYSLTRSLRVSYGAPAGLHDDLVMALCLANWGRSKGQAGGVSAIREVMIPRSQMGRPSIRNPAAAARNKIFGNVFKRRQSAHGMRSNGPFWR